MDQLKKQLAVSSMLLQEPLPSHQQMLCLEESWQTPDRDLVEELVNEITTWNVQYAAIFIRCTQREEENFYLSIHRIKAYSPKTFRLEPTLRLFNIYIPETLRKKGLCSWILSQLETRAQKEGRNFLISPIIEEDMMRLVSKLSGYIRRTPLDYIYIQ